MSEKTKKKKIYCSIGGQAVLEGVMMMGKTCMATAVRDPDGQIQVEAKRLKVSPSLARASKIPFVRGIVNMVASLVRGTGTLMRSAAVYGEEEEAGRDEPRQKRAEKNEKPRDVCRGASESPVGRGASVRRGCSAPAGTARRGA